MGVPVDQWAHEPVPGERGEPGETLPDKFPAFPGFPGGFAHGQP